MVSVIWHFMNIIFIKFGFTPCKADQPLQDMELQEKEVQKDESIQENYFKRAQQIKLFVTSRLKAI